MNSPTFTPTFATVRVAFIGGGNMASAIIGGLVREGLSAQRIQVVDPNLETRERLGTRFGVQTRANVQELQACDVILWAVKPQVFKAASQDAARCCSGALHLSVAAGIGSDSIAQWVDTERVVRAMPNTPALIGQGATGLYARAAVTGVEKHLVQQLLAPTGLLEWVEREELLDAVTAISGSGPAYVFYFLEVLEQTGQEMGLTAAQAKQLAIATFKGAASLAESSDESPAVLRERVTSKGGTTHAAIQTLENANVRQAFANALHANRARAKELGQEFGA